MTPKTTLKILFGGIFVSMVLVTGWASLHQPVQHWGGLIAEPDRYWTIATLMDAYFGFLTFYVWVFYKELRWLPRIGWFAAIMLLGNMAMSGYLLYQLMRLRSGDGPSAILTARNA